MTRNALPNQSKRKVELWFLCTALRVIARNMHIKFGDIWTHGDNVTLRTKMLFKNQRGLIKKWNKAVLWFLCTALRVIARNMHTKFGVIWTYDDKVTLRTRNALLNYSKGGNSKQNNLEFKFLCTALCVIARIMHHKFRVNWTYGDKVMLRTRNAL